MSYFSLDEISREIDVSVNTLRKYCSQLGFDTKKIGKKQKNELLKASEGTIQRKNEAKSFTDAIKSTKVALDKRLVGQTTDNLKIMLDLAKKDFDDNQKSILECQVAIDKLGTIISNGNNGSVSSNPAVKTKNDLLKSQSQLRKDIMVLEEALANRITDDEDSPFGDE